MDEDELQGIVAAEISDAADFIDMEVGQDRAESTKYYRGDPAILGTEDGRSTVISNDVRDTVQAILPNLMRVFLGADRTVEFVPQGPKDAQVAEQATDYINHILHKDNDGFLTLHSAFKDALVRKVGIVKFWWGEIDKTSTHSYTGVDA